LSTGGDQCDTGWGTFSMSLYISFWVPQRFCDQWKVLRTRQSLEDVVRPCVKHDLPSGDEFSGVQLQCCWSELSRGLKVDQSSRNYLSWYQIRYFQSLVDHCNWKAYTAKKKKKATTTTSTTHFCTHRVVIENEEYSVWFQTELSTIALSIVHRKVSCDCSTVVNKRFICWPKKHLPLWSNTKRPKLTYHWSNTKRPKLTYHS
jgi:hypothetical protein